MIGTTNEDHPREKGAFVGMSTILPEERPTGRAPVGLVGLARRPGVWIALVLAVGVVGMVVLRARGPRVRTVLPRRQDIQQHIVASARVWVPSRVQVAAQSAGRVKAVAVREGDRVSAGQLLLELDDADARAAVNEAKAAVSQARARVAQLRRVGDPVATEGLREAETNLERALADLAQIEKLGAAGVVPLIDVGNARRAVDLARAQQRAALAQRVAAARGGADSGAVQASLGLAQAQLAASELRLTQTKIVVPQDGMVISRSVEPGDVVQPSRTLMVVAAGDSSPVLAFQSDERNLASLHPGQRAVASADAYPAQIFSAEVYYIAPAVDPARGSIEVRLRVLDRPPFLKPDMTVSVDLTVAQATAALTLPTDAIRALASPAPWIFVVEAGRVVRREVRLGIRGEGAVAITSDLDERTEVVLDGMAVLSPGQRVRPSREGR